MVPRKCLSDNEKWRLRGSRQVVSECALRALHALGRVFMTTYNYWATASTDGDSAGGGDGGGSDGEVSAGGSGGEFSASLGSFGAV